VSVISFSFSVVVSFISKLELLRTVTSTADELSVGTNIDDLEGP